MKQGLVEPITIQILESSCERSKCFKSQQLRTKEGSRPKRGERWLSNGIRGINVEQDTAYANFIPTKTDLITLEIGTGKINPPHQIKPSFHFFQENLGLQTIIVLKEGATTEARQMMLKILE